MKPSGKESQKRLLIAFAVLVIGLACMCNGLSIPLQSPTATPQVPATPTKTQQVESALNSSGPWLLIATDGGLWVANPDGSNSTRIWQGNFWQADLTRAIQPGGNQVVLLTSESDQYHHLALNLLSLLDGHLQKITDLTTPQTEPGPDAGPGDTSLEAVRAIVETISFAWSPDGTKLAFVGVMDGPTAEVYLYDTETQAVRRVSQDDAQDFWPSWSPDGKHILFFGADGFGTGAGYAMNGVWTADGDGSNASLLYATSSSGEELVGWRDDQTAVLATWNMMCGPGNLRLYNIVSAAQTILQADCFNSAAVGLWNGSDPSRVMFSTSDGLYFLAGNSNQVQKVSDQSARSVRWDTPGYMFVVQFVDGSISTFYKGDAIDTYDAPFTSSSGIVDVTMYGLIWAWTDSGDELEGVWVTGPGIEVGQIFNQSARLPLWDLHNNLVFFSGNEGRTNLYRVTFDAYYQDVTIAAQFNETVQEAAWVGVK
jgi:WD40-like Beta Propeller Repeat